MAERSNLERQIEANRALYTAERESHDTIRAALAVPVALLAVAAFGVGLEARNFAWSQQTALSAGLSWVVAVLIVFAVLALLIGVALLLRYPYDTRPIEPNITAVSTTASELAEELTDDIGHSAAADDFWHGYVLYPG